MLDYLLRALLVRFGASLPVFFAYKKVSVTLAFNPGHVPHCGGPKGPRKQTKESDISSEYVWVSTAKLYEQHWFWSGPEETHARLNSSSYCMVGSF